MPTPVTTIPPNALVRIQKGKYALGDHVGLGMVLGPGLTKNTFAVMASDQTQYNNLPIFGPDITPEDEAGLDWHGVLVRGVVPPSPPRQPEFNAEELAIRFASHGMSSHGQRTAALIRSQFKDLASTLANVTPPSRELSLAITKLEEASFWAIAGLARSPARGVQMPNE